MNDGMQEGTNEARREGRKVGKKDEWTCQDDQFHESQSLSPLRISDKDGASSVLGRHGTRTSRTMIMKSGIIDHLIPCVEHRSFTERSVALKMQFLLDARGCRRRL